LELQNITLIVHDFGGPIGLAWAQRHTDKIKRVVVLNSWLWSSVGDPDYEKLRKVLKSPLLPLLYRQLNISPRFILPASFGRHKLSKHLKLHYRKPFATNKEREGALAFARSLLHDQPWFDELWQQKEKLAQLPALIIWGTADPVIGILQRDRWQDVFPLSSIKSLEGVGHFPQEESAEEVSRLLYDYFKTC
jgi:haloalkane dehalogenase